MRGPPSRTRDTSVDREPSHRGSFRFAGLAARSRSRCSSRQARCPTLAVFRSRGFHRHEAPTTDTARRLVQLFTRPMDATTSRDPHDRAVGSTRAVRVTHRPGVHCRGSASPPSPPTRARPHALVVAPSSAWPRSATFRPTRPSLRVSGPREGNAQERRQAPSTDRSGRFLAVSLATPRSGLGLPEGRRLFHRGT